MDRSEEYTSAMTNLKWDNPIYYDAITKHIHKLKKGKYNGQRNK